MKIKAIEMDNGEWVYMQVDDGLQFEEAPPADSGGFERKGAGTEMAKQAARSLRGVIKAVANTTLNAVRESLGANVDKVTLEFGVTLGGEAGIPFVTSGKAEGAVKVAVECSFKSPQN